MIFEFVYLYPLSNILKVEKQLNFLIFVYKLVSIINRGHHCILITHIKTTHTHTYPIVYVQKQTYTDKHTHTLTQVHTQIHTDTLTITVTYMQTHIHVILKKYLNTITYTNKHTHPC